MPAEVVHVTSDGGVACVALLALGRLGARDERAGILDHRCARFERISGHHPAPLAFEHAYLEAQFPVLARKHLALAIFLRLLTLFLQSTNQKSQITLLFLYFA